MNYRTKHHSNCKNNVQEKLNPDYSILHCLWWVNFALCCHKGHGPCSDSSVVLFTGAKCCMSWELHPAHSWLWHLVKPLWNTPNHRNRIACLTETFCFSLVNWVLTSLAEQKACLWGTLSLPIPAPLHGVFILGREIHVRPCIGEHFSYFFPTASFLLTEGQTPEYQGVRNRKAAEGSRKKSEGPGFWLSRWHVSWFKST